MTLIEILSSATRAGISLRVAEGKLQYESLPGKLTEELREAIRQQKDALVELFSTLQYEPDRSPFAALIRQAREGSLQLGGIILSDFQTVTDGNRFVMWALSEIEKGTHHRMECILHLAQIVDATR